jgi:chromosome segregation ATPase
MENPHFDHPNLFSWNNELLTKIKDKEDNIKHIYNDMTKIEEYNNSKENEILSLENAMKNILSNVEKCMSSYSKSISDKLDKFKNEEYSRESNIKYKSKCLFSLHKELHKDACEFFSKQEFKEEQSNLKIKLDDKLIKICNYIFRNDDSNWIDVLTPIWEVENQYKDMEINYQKLKDIYKYSLKKYNDKKNVYTKHNEEINMMKKELEALQEFSNKIKNLKENENVSNIDSVN